MFLSQAGDLYLLYLLFSFCLAEDNPQEHYFEGDMILTQKQTLMFHHIFDTDSQSEPYSNTFRRGLVKDMGRTWKDAIVYYTMNPNVGRSMPAGWPTFSNLASQWILKMNFMEHQMCRTSVPFSFGRYSSGLLEYICKVSLYLWYEICILKIIWNDGVRRINFVTLLCLPCLLGLWHQIYK